MIFYIILISQGLGRMNFDPACIPITKDILPAVRAAIAETLSKKYGYRQVDVAKKLGVAQVAVSKYLNKRYSKRVARIKEYVMEKRMLDEVIKEILGGDEQKRINKEIDIICSSDSLLDFSTKQV